MRYGYLKQMGPEVQLGSFAFEMLASGLPTMRALDGWTPAGEERFLEAVRTMLADAEEAEARFARNWRREIWRHDRLDERRSRGEPAPAPRVVQSTTVNARGALSIMLLPLAEHADGPADIEPPAVELVRYRGGRPWFEALHIRRFDIFDRDEREMHAAWRWSSTLVRRFVLHIYRRLQVETRRHFELIEEGVLVHDGDDAEPTALRVITARQAADEAAAAAEAVADRERKAAAQADAEWLASLPVDGASVAATISHWRNAGQAKKVLFDVLASSGILVGYSSFEPFLVRLHRTLDAERPGWEQLEAPSLHAFADARPAVPAQRPGRPSFEDAVRYINERRTAKGMAAVDLDGMPRTEQHLRRFARQSGVVLPRRNELAVHGRGRPTIEDDAS